MKTVWYFHKNRYMDQWNRTEKTRHKPTLLWSTLLILDKAGKNIQWEKNSSKVIQL